MRALSLRQPWAALVVHFGKHIENRRWNTSLRGEFLIHAAKGMTRREFDEAYLFAAERLGDKLPHEAVFREYLQFGGIIGRARLIGVVEPWVAELPHGGPRGDAPMPPELVARFYPPGVDSRWHMREQFGFLLADVVELPFQPCTGRLGFFNLDLEAA